MSTALLNAESEVIASATPQPLSAPTTLVAP